MEAGDLGDGRRPAADRRPASLQERPRRALRGGAAGSRPRGRRRPPASTRALACRPICSRRRGRRSRTLRSWTAPSPRSPARSNPLPNRASRFAAGPEPGCGCFTPPPPSGSRSTDSSTLPDPSPRSGQGGLDLDRTGPRPERRSGILPRAMKEPAEPAPEKEGAGGGGPRPEPAEQPRARRRARGPLSVQLPGDGFRLGDRRAVTGKRPGKTWRSWRRPSGPPAGFSPSATRGRPGFLDLSDGSSRLQVYVRKDAVGERGWELYRALDLGDWIGVEGSVFRTRTGELSVKARQLTFLAKCLRPLPEKWHGLKDVERRYRERHLDLAVNPESRAVFEKRASDHPLPARLPRRPRIPRGRNADDAADPGGRARPALRDAPQRAGSRALPADRARALPEASRRGRHAARLRDQPQLPQRRDLDAAQPRVHDARVLPGLLARGRPDEADGRDALLARAGADRRLPDGLGRRDDLLGAARTGGSRCGRRCSRRRGPIRAEPVTEGELSDAAGLLAAAQRFGVEKPERFAGKKGKLLAELFEAVAESRFVQPTFLHEFPTEISPLSKQDPKDPEWVDRFELYAAGMEIANGFSELNDPVEQEARFREQARAAEAGRPRGAPLRQRLRRRPALRHAPDGGRRRRDRPPDDAPDRQALDPRRHPLPPPEAQGREPARGTRNVEPKTDSTLSTRRLTSRRPASRSSHELRDLHRAAIPRVFAQRAHVALISTISVLGLAVGVAALIISLALLSGFQDRIRAQMAMRSPHLRRLAGARRPPRGPAAGRPRSRRPARRRFPSIRSSRGGDGSATPPGGTRCPCATATSPRARCGSPAKEPRRRASRAPPRRASARRRGACSACSPRARGSRPSARYPIAVLVRVAEIRRGERAGEGAGPRSSRADRAAPGGPAFRRAGLRGPALGPERRGGGGARRVGPAPGGLPRPDVAGIERAPLLRAPPGEGRHLRDGRSRHRRRGPERRLEHRAPRRREEAGPRRPRLARSGAGIAGEDLPDSGRTDRRHRHRRPGSSWESSRRCSSTGSTRSLCPPTCICSRTSPSRCIRARSSS